MVVFATMLSTAVYVIIDLEFPRLGLTRVDAADQNLIEIRQSMQSTTIMRPATRRFGFGQLTRRRTGRQFRCAPLPSGELGR
jgi:hypothetical protein